MARNHRVFVTALLTSACSPKTDASLFACVDEPQERYADDELTPVGVSAADLIEHASGERELTGLHTQDSRPVRMNLTVTRSRGAVRWVHSRQETKRYHSSEGIPSASLGGKEWHSGLVCLDHLQVPVDVSLTTTDGAVAFVNAGVVTTQRFFYDDDPNDQGTDALAWLWADQHVDEVEVFPPSPDYAYLDFDPDRVWVESSFYTGNVTEGGAGWSGSSIYWDVEGAAVWTALDLISFLEWDERE